MKHFFLFIAILGAACAARLTGTITTTTSDTPTYTTIYAKNTETGNVYQTRTSTGQYNINLENNYSYSVFATATGNFNVSGWIVDGYMPVSMGRVTFHGDETITSDLTFEPSYTLVLISYVNGAMRKSSEYSPHLWTTDLSGATSRFYKSLASQNGFTTAALALPLGSKVSIVSEVRLSSGRTLVPADNAGEGFGSSVQGGAIVQLNYERARTAVNAVKRKSQTTEDDGAPNIAAHAATVDALSGPFASEQLRANAADEALEKSVAAETALELSNAERLISNYRTSNVSVRGTDELGRIVPGLSISIKQKSHNFKFGVHGGQKSASGMDAWKMLADSGVNAAVVDFWWSKMEPKKGMIEEEWIINQKIEYLASLGLSLRATGLFQPDPDSLPDYVKGLSANQFGEALYNHVYTLVTRYCTNFDLIEVSTDLNNLASMMGYNTTEILALQQISLDAIRAAAPGVRTSVTVSNAFDPKFPASSLSVAQYHMKWAPQQVDQIGQALYNGDGDQPRYSIGALSDLLDTAASCGRPMRISQVSAPFVTADQTAEKEYLKQLYTIAFSKRMMREVSWWDFMGKGALFADDQSPNPSYYALKEFLQSIRSDIQLNVDGKVTYISPYGGTHQVTVYKDGAIIGQSEISVDEGRLNNMAVLYRSDGSGVVFVNQPNGPVLGVVPAPLPPPSTPAGNSRIPQWSVFVIIFGSIALASTVALLAAFLVLRRNKAKDISGPIEGKVIAGKTFEIDLEAGPTGNAVPEVTSLDDAVPDSPSPWSGQPLTNVVLDEIDDEVEQQSESDDDSSELEDVELDEQDISTSTTDTEEEEEHL